MSTMKNKAFTLIELLVVIAIIVILGGLLLGGVSSCVNFPSTTNNSGQINPYWFPEQAKAQSQQEMAEQMRIQNDLLRKQLELKELELNNR